MRIVALALMVSALTWARVARAQDQTALADEAYRQALALYNAHDDDRALVLFRSSLALHGSPNARLGLARCLRSLGRVGEASAEYARVVSEVAVLAGDDRYVRTGEVAREEGDALAARVGRIRVRVVGAPSSAHVLVDGRDVPMAAASVAIPVTAGAVTVVVTDAGHELGRHAVRIAARTASDVTLTLAAGTAPSHDRGFAWRDVGWTGLALGGSALVAYIVLAVATDQQFHALASTGACNAALTECGPEAAQAVATGRAMQTATNVSLGVGVGVGVLGAAALVTGVVLAQPDRARVGVAIGASRIELVGRF